MSASNTYTPGRYQQPARIPRPPTLARSDLRRRAYTNLSVAIVNDLLDRLLLDLDASAPTLLDLSDRRPHTVSVQVLGLDLTVVLRDIAFGEVWVKATSRTPRVTLSVTLERLTGPHLQIDGDPIERWQFTANAQTAQRLASCTVKPLGFAAYGRVAPL